MAEKNVSVLCRQDFLTAMIFFVLFFGNKNSNREQLATFSVVCTDRNILATAGRRIGLIFVSSLSYPQEMKKL